MNIVIDIGTSGFKGSVCTLTQHFYFNRPVDYANGGAQAFYMEKGWLYDTFIDVSDKRKYNNRIYDIHDILRLLTDSSVVNDLVVKNRWSFGCVPKETGDIELTVTYGEEKHKELLSNLNGDIQKYIEKRVIAEMHGDNMFR